MCLPARSVSFVGMRRSRFLKLSALSLPAVACGIPAVSPFQAWIQRFSAEVESDSRCISVVASVSPGRLAQALHALDSVTDGPLRCDGAIMRGWVGGKEFRLRLV